MCDPNKWIVMKTYTIKQEKDILKLLENNKNIKNANNAFEIVFKYMQNKSIKQVSNGLGMDIVKFKSDMVRLKIKRVNASIQMAKEKSQNYDIIFVNVKNKDGDYFSTLVNNSNPNDKILIINGHLFEFNLPGNHEKSSNISVQSETNSKVIHFKFSDLSFEKTKPLYQNNLSKLADPGVYSLFGNVSKTLKYNDEDLMLLRIQCCDKSCIETHKYPHYVYNFKDISKEEKRLGIKSDLNSNQVDILVESPSSNFLSLHLGQRIFLNNIRMEFSTDLNMFYLHISGAMKNIEASPTGTGIVNSLVPHRRHYKIPNELRPATQCKTNQVSDNDESNKFNKFQKLDGNYQLHRLSDLSSDDNDNNLSTSTKVCDNNINRKTSIDMQCPTHIKNKKTISNSPNCNEIQNCPMVLPNSLSDENIEPKQMEIILEETKLQDLRTDSSISSCSPPFFTPDHPDPDKPIIKIVDNVVEFKSKPQSTKCLGFCRLIYIEPNILINNHYTENQDFISGYCTKCLRFFPESSLVKSKSHEIYYCPMCEDISHLTFFFKMTFLYGQNDRFAMEVSCYNNDAERVIKKLTKKKIKVENYSANRKCIMDTLQSFITKKTRVNIIVEESPMDNVHILRDIDTKFVVSSPLH
ncbi:Hypothetical protein CINCED_3A009748 [Cinara cedri]|uniref:Uncharacterized protein n=1 Tax=Cinara cedri TaxID=506608 RepID=A0A5E4MGK5_9HEMI|nr:Hypothetical protein CINCED_3A009748 [Cinara cedri]